MHAALILLARAIALAHDHWRRTVGRRRPLSDKIGPLEEQLQRLRLLIESVAACHDLLHILFEFSTRRIADHHGVHFSLRRFA